MMNEPGLRSLHDFSAGCFFATLLVGCFILRTHERKAQAHRLGYGLFLWLALMNCVFFVDFYVVPLFGPTKALSNLYQATAIPLCLCLLYELSHPGKTNWKTVMQAEAPFLVAILCYLIWPSHTLYIAIMSLAALASVAGLAQSIRDIRRYNQAIKRWSSYTENVSIQWLYYIYALMLTLFLAWTLTNIAQAGYATVVYNMACCVIFFSLAFHLSHHRVVVFEECDPQTDKSTRRFHFADSLQRAFEVEQIWQDPKLTIVNLATRLGTNRTYLSQYFNNELQQPFYTYVNNYRITYAKSLLLEQDYTLDIIAEMTGFNSLSSFRRTFLAQEGVTPGEFRRQYRKEKT